MLVLDFINVGNGDSALIREMENGVQKYAMILSCSYRLFNGNCCCSVKLRINLKWIKQKQYIN